jgi:hypothetical protein
MYNVFAKNMIARWDKNLNSTRDDWFVGSMIQDILKKKAHTIRIHPEGDFYSQAYLDSWKTIAKCLPDVSFYCYTKALHLNWEGLPDNFKMIQSYGGEHDSLINTTLPHAIIFNSVEEMKASTFINCSNDDLLAAAPDTIKIGLIAH